MFSNTALKFCLLKFLISPGLLCEAFPYHKMICSYYPYYKVPIVSWVVFSNATNNTWLQIRVPCITVYKFLEDRDWNLFIFIYCVAMCRELGHIHALKFLILNWRILISVFLVCVCVCVCVCSVAQLCLTLCNPMDCSPPWDSLGKNTGVHCDFLFQIFLTQGSNMHLLHWQVDSLPLSHLGIPYVPWQSPKLG